MGGPQLTGVLAKMRSDITDVVAAMPTHQQFLDRHLLRPPRAA